MNQAVKNSHGQPFYLRDNFAPVFVARAGASSEDDGWLLSYVYDKATDKSEVLILDASDLEGEPVARVHLPARVPMGFHGSWVPF